jgi:hypothetical protein
MNASEAKRLQAIVTDWVTKTDDLRALALCGSWATGSARRDSDLDLLVLARPPAIASRSEALAAIPFTDAGFQLDACRWVTYGVVHSAHTALKPTAEVELSFAALSWANTSPIDDGTRRVVSDGFGVLVDKDGALSALREATKRSRSAYD